MTTELGTVYKQTFKKEDFLFRARSSGDEIESGGLYDIEYFDNTVDFVYKMGWVWMEDQSLRWALKNIWKEYQYSQEYISFLLGIASKEEFKKKAKEFAKPFISLNDLELKFAAETVLSTLGQPLTSSQLSLFLNVDPTAFETRPLLEHESEKED
jgi:hypothetical protein